MRKVVLGVWLLLQTLAFGIELWVDPSNLTASDAGDGSEASPLVTVAEALQRALPELENDAEVTIYLGEGVYRERVQLHRPEYSAARGSLALRGALNASVVWRGSERVDNWKVQGQAFSREYALPRLELSGRMVAEEDPLLVFVADVRLMRAQRKEGLAMGYFFPEQEHGVLHLVPPRNAVLTDGAVEIASAIKEPLLSFSGLKELHIENIQIERSGGGRIEGGAALQVREVEQVTLDSVSLRWNGWGGGIIEKGQRVDVLRSSVSHNGAYGLWIKEVEQVRVAGCRFDLNNWRGAEAGNVTATDRVGLRIEEASHVELNRNRMTDNHATGLQLSAIDQSVELRKQSIAGNKQDGMRIEEAGAVYADEVQLLYNGGAGAYVGQVDVTTWRYGLAYGNEAAALQLNLSTSSVWDMSDTLLVSGSEPLIQLLAQQPKWEGTQNLYFRQDAIDAVVQSGATLLSLDDWSRRTGSDLRSRFADPLLQHAENYNFSFTPQSPWRQRSEWQKRNLDSAAE